jgi:cytidine deaminase
MTKEEFNTLKQTTKLSENDLLLTLAMEGKKFSTNVPFSNFQVGAAVLTKDGNVYIGANSELQYNDLILTIHAEGSAVHHALLQNPDSPVVKMAINEPPCGYCRQFLSELVSVDYLQVITQNGIKLLNELLPDKFSPSNLGLTTSLYNFPKYNLKVNSVNISPGINSNYMTQINQTLDLATKSYSPYTNKPLSTLVEFNNGNKYGGLYIENAAFNPTIGPITTALNHAFLYGEKLDDLKNIFIAQTDKTLDIPNFNQNINIVNIAIQVM